MVTELWTYDEVAHYLYEASGGLIGAADGASAPPPPLNYTRTKTAPAHFVPTPPRIPAVDQESYTFDVPGFIAKEGAADFADAKRRFYSQLPWDEREQTHRLPYSTPAAWTTLNHPPIKRLVGPARQWTSLFADAAPDADPTFTSPYFDPDFQAGLDAGGSALTHGNTTRLLANHHSYEEKLRLIADAKDHLYIAVMFWACDSTADALTEALGARVRDGVDVRLMTEGLYRETITRRCIDRLEAAGVKMVNHRDALRASSFGAVLHWKVWIRDGEELIIGGQNVGNYENSSDGFNFLDRDNDVLVRGPSVADAETAWLDAWDARGGAGGTSAVRAAADAAKAQQEREHLRGAANYAHWLGNPATRMDGNCRVMMQGVHATPNAIAPVVQRYLDGSQRQVVFSSPTVRYDYKESINTRNTGLAVHRLMRSLREDVRPGRKVVVLTNGVGGGMGESQTWLRARRDHALRREQWAFYGILRQFNELVARRSAVANRAVTLPLAENPNVEVWTYFQYIHTKIWLFDRVAAMVGSWNLDENSTDLNPEAAILCLDGPLRDAVEADLTLALVNAVPEISAPTGSADVANVQNY